MSAPKPFPLSQFDTLTDGQPIGCIMGKLTKLYDQKTGSNSVGPWSLQNGEIEQDGVSVPICLKDRPEIDKSWRGKTILITAQKDKQLTGVYCWDDDRSTPQVRKVKVTATATIDIVNADAPAQQQPAPQQQHQPQGQTSTNKEAPALQDPPPKSQTQIPPKPADAEAKAFKEARKTMLQIANLHLMAMLTVERYSAPAFKELTGQDMSESQRQAAVASIFIKADRESLTRHMPAHDATKDPRFQMKQDH